MTPFSHPNGTSLFGYFSQKSTPLNNVDSVGEEFRRVDAAALL
ncbi:MAG: hypothetical protein AAF387_21785 [Pseudomonadota bacterium]